MKTINEAFDELDGKVREVADLKHTLAYVAADKRLTDTAKINVASNAIAEAIVKLEVMKANLEKVLS